MYMYYKNDEGKVDFRFGGSYPIRVTDIEGLYPPARTYNTVSYADMDGVDTISSVLGGRTVTVGGDILISNQKFLTDVLKVLNKPGELYMGFGGKKRKLICRSAEFTPGSRNAMYMKFVIVFFSDKPYFYDFDLSSFYVGKRENNVRESFVLPCVFTSRTARKNIIISGDVESEPTFEIICVKPADDENIGGIVITNESYDTSINLEIKLVENEVITVDIENRKITSNKRGNLINYISEDTFLNRFRLEKGPNMITVTNYNAGESASVVCKCCNRYLEGVY